MRGYVLANVSWTDQSARRAYVDLLGQSLEAHDGAVIARTQYVRVLEGDWQPDGILVLISFPTVEDALIGHLGRASALTFQRARIQQLLPE
jgi:uncharacterized protein (DUF1330 family)